MNACHNTSLVTNNLNTRMYMYMIVHCYLIRSLPKYDSLNINNNNIIIILRVLQYVAYQNNYNEKLIDPLNINNILLS